MSDPRAQSPAEPRPEPNIVVDEDWKSRVQAEKEAAAKKRDAEQPDAPPATDDVRDADARSGPLPPASFELLVGMLWTQAVAAMGKMPDPVEGHAVVRPDVAKHYIDMLNMLEQKTKGNLTSNEAEMLSGLVHELRMMFLTIRREPASDGQAAG